jgi:hypothetical protein
MSPKFLLFAHSLLGIRPYDWQCHILLNYEAGFPTAAACANFTGKTSTVFPIAALWTLYSFPRGSPDVSLGNQRPGSEPILCFP